MQAYSKITTNVASRAQGVHGSGARTYKPEMATRILFILRNECVGPDNAMTVEALAARVGLNGRAVRQAVGDMEVGGVVLTDQPTKGAAGYFICDSADQAESFTRRLESQVEKMQRRIDARRRSAAALVAA